MQKNAYSVKWAHLLCVTFVIYRRTFPNSLFITIYPQNFAYVVPREIKNNAYANFWRVNKVHYGLCENSE